MELSIDLVMCVVLETLVGLVWIMVVEVILFVLFYCCAL